MDSAATDPKGLIRESYRIDGIRPDECRSIFLDWALSLPENADVGAVIPTLLAQYGDPNPDHPMTAVLKGGMAALYKPVRRGGRAAKFPES